MSEKCKAIHPDFQEVNCALKVKPHGDRHLNGYTPHGPLEWDNLDFVIRRPQESAKSAQVRLAEMANTVPAEVHSLPNKNTVGKMRTDAPPTQEEAAYTVMPRTGTQRMTVLERIVEAGERGQTDDEVADATGIYRSSVTPRRLELREGGWIDDSGTQRQTGHGGNGIVWVATEKANNALGKTVLKNFD